MFCDEYCGSFFFFQAEDGIRDLVRSRGLGDVYKRQVEGLPGGDRRCIPERCGAGVYYPSDPLLDEGRGVERSQGLSLIHI